MTDHHYERTLTSKPAGSRRHVGLILAGAAILAAAVLAWAFSRQQVVDSPLPQPAHAGVQPPPAPAAAAPTESFTAPPPIHQAAAPAAPVVAQPQTAPSPAAPAMPTSEDVAAVGDTRSVQP